MNEQIVNNPTKILPFEEKETQNDSDEVVWQLKAKQGAVRRGAKNIKLCKKGIPFISEKHL